SGDYEGTALVAERLANKGAHKAIRPLTQDATTPRWWTRTSAHANWKLLAQAGPLLETRAASELVRFCLDMLHTGPLSSFARVSEPIRYRQTSEVVRALAGSLAAAENTAIAEAAEWTLGEVAKEQTDP